MLSYDPDDPTTQGTFWWNEIGNKGPKPYETAAWTCTTILIDENESHNPSPLGDQDDFSYEAEALWWQEIDGEGPKPYEFTSWTVTISKLFESGEFIAVPTADFFSFESGFFNSIAPNFFIDSGNFQQKPTITYDDAIFTEDEKEVFVKRIIYKLMIYDAKASGPGNLGSLLQPLGQIGTDPPGISEDVITDPEELFIEPTRSLTEEDDIPPGVLLGTVSYETFNGILTIIDWNHINWEDDSPTRMGIKTLLSQLPEGIVEVRVMSSPQSFWTSLGFSPDFKGDPYLHVYL